MKTTLQPAPENPPAIRAFLCDLARSQRADAAQLRDVVRNVAELGYTMLFLYMEHRFDYPSCPGLAPPGSLTAGQARALTAFGSGLGVEIVPMINVMGHCEGIGATERYAHLACDPYQQAPWGGYEQLNLELPETRTLIRAMLNDICEAFPGRWLNLGGDEVRNMACLFPDHPDIRVSKMIGHYRFVLEEGRLRGRRLFLAGDMLVHHPELREALPRDLWILVWHYGPSGAREKLELFQREGFQVVAMPAVTTCSRFAVASADSILNIRHMAGDAVALHLDGFALATWEFGFGSGLHLVWPWAALAAAWAKGQDVPDPGAFLAGFAASRYGVEGRAFLRLHALLDTELLEALREAGSPKPYLLALLRKGLFRGLVPFLWLARSGQFPDNRHQAVSEVSPFLPWLLLRPALAAPRLLARLQAIAAEAQALAGRFAEASGEHAKELVPIVGLAEAFAVLVERVGILESAKGLYHEAALAQSGDALAFVRRLNAAADELEAIRPGLNRLRGVVKRLDAVCAIDRDEQTWLDIQERSLDEHIAALRAPRAEADSLLEFGAFLTRPAHVTPRLTWR